MFSLFPLVLVITQYFPSKLVVFRYLRLQVGTVLAQLKNGVNYKIMCDFTTSTWIHLIDNTVIFSYSLNR